jgi:hypothetical protein
MQKQIKELQDQVVKTHAGLVMAMAELKALRQQLITATQGKH